MLFRCKKRLQNTRNQETGCGVSKTSYKKSAQGGVPEISVLAQRITVTDLIQFLSSATLYRVVLF